jgi:PAS domain-containing protein
VFAASARSESRTFETERVRKDGTTVSVALSVSPIRDATAAVTGVSATIRDVSDRKRIEAALRESQQRVQESEERLRLTLTGAGQGTWDWNLGAGTLSWDDRCKAIHGLPQDSPVTYEWHLGALHADDRERVFNATSAAIRSRTEFVEELIAAGPTAVQEEGRGGSEP